MAEILLSLTIIGVVAAITLPSLTGNINERTWNTQRKALFARMSQAIALMPALNGFGTLESVSASGAASINGTAAETFIAAGLSKVLKINNICDGDHIQDCGLVSQITTLNASAISTPRKMSQLNRKMLNNVGNATYGTSYSFLDTKAAAFETGNGESILVFYNPHCQAYMNENTAYYMAPKVCANFIFDLNGNKGPNTVGKDIGFMTILYPTDSVVVAPNIPVQKASAEVSQQGALSVCRKQDEEFRIPNLDELASMFVNQSLIGGNITNTSLVYWSSTLYDSAHGWAQGFNTGSRIIYPRNSQYNVHCVKR